MKKSLAYLVFGGLLPVASAQTMDGSPDSENVARIVLEAVPHLTSGASDIELLSVTESPAARHYLYWQTWNGVPVYRATVKLNVSRSGRILSLFDHTYIIRKAPEGDFPSAGAATSFIEDREPEGAVEWQRQEAVYFRTENGPAPALLLTVLTTDHRHYEAVLDRQGRVLHEHNLCLYYKPQQDSTVAAKVFLPDPLTTASATYGGSYTDNGDADDPALNNERRDVTIDVTFLNDTFRLDGAYAAIRDFSPPNIPPAFSTTPSFGFMRSQDGFEDVNAYYHVSVFQGYVQSLGFTNLVNAPIWIDTHAMNGTDNSQFIAGTPHRLFFGEGGVDDAEDADVIIHEYTHAISQDAAPGTNTGTERQALDEANGDYFAASYSRSLNGFGWDKVFIWDGHNEFWSGRFAISVKHYPEDLAGDIYADAEIWAATLMEIWGDVGRQSADRTLLQSMYSYANGMSMRDAAVLYVQADSLITGGANYGPIYNRMVARGLLEDSCLAKGMGAMTPDAGRDTVVCSGQPVTLGGNPLLPPAATPDSVRWSPPGALLCTVCPQPVATPLVSMTYQVTAYKDGCRGTDTVRVEVVTCPAIVMLADAHRFLAGEGGTRLIARYPTSMRLRLFDDAGRLVWVDEAEVVNEYVMGDISVPAGLYLLTVNVPDETINLRLVRARR